jgi:predicted Zn-dependent peptidase
MFRKITLKNGLRLITAPIPGNKTATILILVKTGSKHETKETNGISHFLEHMFFKGTEKRPTPADIVKDMDRIGGEYNAFTSKETTGYYAKVDSKHLDLSLDWISDIFLNSKFDEAEIKKEKRVILEEINMYYDLPMQHVGVLWEELLYGDQPAGWPVWGKKEVILKMARKDFLNYLKTRYSARNSLVCVAGNFNNKEIAKKIEKYFGRLDGRKFTEKRNVVEKQSKPEKLIHFKKTDQTHLCLGVRGYNIFHKDRYIIKILGMILGGFMSSRLFQEVREKKGLAYYIRTSTDSNPDTGYLVTQAGVANEKAEEAVKTILGEYQKIKTGKISADELGRAKEHIKGNMLLNLETSDELASFVAGQEIFKEEILTPEQVFAKIDKVSIDDIKRVAQDIFKPDKLNLALIGPFEDKKIFEGLLRI